MYCIDCGKKLNNGETTCSSCGISADNCKTKKPSLLKKIKDFIIKYRTILLIFLILIFIIILIVIFNKKDVNPIESVISYYTFDVNGEKFLIGQKGSYYEEKGYSYKDSYYSDSDFIVSDGFAPHLFYKEGNAVMYAAMHCKEDKICNYSEANVIKINFYDSIGTVTLADFITIGTTYDEVEQKLGKPDGKIYTNDNEKVWSFYDKGKIDNPYYVLEFDRSNKVVSMKIGMWWYEDEYEHTIKK